MGHNLSRRELETIIIYNQEDDTMLVETPDKALIRKLDKHAEKSPTVVVEKEDEIFKRYIMPKKMLRICLPKQYSEEQLEKMRETARVNLVNRNRDKNDE